MDDGTEQSDPDADPPHHVVAAIGIVQSAAQPNADKRAELKRAFVDWVSQFSTDLGIALTYQYLVTVGIRK